MDLFKCKAMKGLLKCVQPQNSPLSRSTLTERVLIISSLPTNRSHIYHKPVFLLIQQILTEHQQCARICRVWQRIQKSSWGGIGDGESLETAEKQFLEARGSWGKSRALAGAPSARENVCESTRHNAGSVSNI